MRWRIASSQIRNHSSAQSLVLIGLVGGLAFAINGCRLSSNEAQPTPAVNLPADLDEDGYDTQVDCNDVDVGSYPGANESCDGVDNDCDGQIDEGLDVDADQDGYSGCPTSTSALQDCDDNSAASSPSQIETCDHADNDCDGTVDNGFDQDGDGYTSCSETPDCDDQNSNNAPGVSEVCDAIDNDCDGNIDEDLATDSNEPNDDREKSTYLGSVTKEVPIMGQGSIQAAGDIDWYSFSLGDTPSAQMALTISLTDIPSDAEYGISLFADDMESSVAMSSPEEGSSAAVELSLDELASVPEGWQLQVFHRSGAYGCPRYHLVISLVERTPALVIHHRK